MIQKEYIKPELTIVILKPHNLLQNSVKTENLEGFKGFGGPGGDEDEGD